MTSEMFSAIVAFLGVVVSAIASASLTNWRLQQLEKKVDEHNGWGEKFTKQSTDIALIQQDIKFIKEKIERLDK